VFVFESQTISGKLYKEMIKVKLNIFVGVGENVVEYEASMMFTSPYECLQQILD